MSDPVKNNRQPFKHYTRLDVVLKYADETESNSETLAHEYTAESAEYNWTEGNMSCDCNRAMFFKRELDCGHTIQLVSLTFS